MDLLLWITISFIVIGFVVIFSMKKRMESRVAFLKSNTESEGDFSKANPVIWWIWGTVAWGIVSMFLVVRCFQNYFG